MNSEKVRHWGIRPLLAAAVLAGATSLMQSCEDEILTGQPGWLGNSIYERLQEEGGYSTTLKLIDDLGLHDVMSKTGSKTLFAADDEAYKVWFANNTWGVREYKDLTMAQKKLLLNSAMVNNAYLVELLSNVSGNPPETGKCMRRETAASIYDSVAVVRPEEMPNTRYWSRFVEAGRSIPLLKDDNAPTMIHLLPAYMKHNKMKDSDLRWLTNGEASSISEAYVNGRKIIERDITCKNGYIHKVDGVMEPATNMAEVIRTNPLTSQWGELLDRFSAPFYNHNATKEYNRLYNNQDSVFVKRYFSELSADGKLQYDSDNNKVGALLAFDPGWNHYMYSNTMGYDLHYDAGAMIVPTNDALNNWFESSALKRQFGKWENVTDLVLSKLLRVNMIDNFSEKVPSKFDNILNDAKIEMGIKEENIKECIMTCNGVVYIVDKVFPPSEYSSVAFPALIDQDNFSCIYWAIDALEFDPYLGSMDSRYGLILPTDEALVHYIDPICYGEPDQSYLKFYYDKVDKEVKAERWSLTYNEDGTPNFEGGTRLQSNVSENIIKDRLEDLLDQCIIVLDHANSDVQNKVSEIDNSHSFYKTKGGSLIKAKVNGGSFTFQGGWQMEHNLGIEILPEDVIKAENGHSYVASSMPFGASKTVYNVVSTKDEYKMFYKMLNGGDPDSVTTNLLVSSISKDKYSCPGAATGNLNMRLFDNYNYTVYVPKNEAIQKLIDEGYLPTWDDFDTYYQLLENTSDPDLQETYRHACYVIKNRICDFVRYHVQDNSVAIGGQEVNGTAYESMLRNPVTNRFYPLTVSSNKSGLTVVDALGNRRHVTMTPGNYNEICREYWLQGKGNARTIYQASDAVIHQIDGVLMYENLTKWKDEINI